MRTDYLITDYRLEDRSEKQKQSTAHDHHNGEGKEPRNQDISYGIGLKILYAFAGNHTTGNTGGENMRSAHR